MSISSRKHLGWGRGAMIELAQTRRAVLSALLTKLRQSVGSCFATAPAIIIQAEQIHQFLSDIEEIFRLGGLKRTIQGEEYFVPTKSELGVR